MKNIRIWCNSCRVYVQATHSVTTYDCPHCEKALLFYIPVIDKRKLEISHRRISRAYTSAVKRGKIDCDFAKQALIKKSILDTIGELVELKEAVQNHLDKVGSLHHVAMESADVVICLFTLSYLAKVDINKIKITEGVEIQKDDVIKGILSLIELLYSDGFIEHNIGLVINVLLDIANFFKFNLNDAVEEKMEYNETRSD